MPDKAEKAQLDHHMLPGSHERPTGPQCACGAQWSLWDGICVATAPWSMLSAKGQAERLATMPAETVGEALQHIDETGHCVDWNDECHLWACFDCAWTDSSFVVISHEGAQ